jgi:hypothetical protein
MNTKTRWFLFAGLMVVVLSLLLDTVLGAPSDSGNALCLRPPSFIGVAQAAGDVSGTSTASFLENEAGISAYTNIGRHIELSLVRATFRTIERETPEYIVGSVGIPDYTDNYDPHVYVHTDGWVVAYYLAADPTAIMVDLRHYDGATITTMLGTAIKQVLAEIGVVTFEADYYDFRFPSATNLMLVAELATPPNGSFEVKLPEEFDYFERSWSHVQDEGGVGWSESNFHLDDVRISNLGAYGGWVLAHGTLTLAQLPPGVFHTIRVNLGGGKAFGSIALTYRETP